MPHLLNLFRLMFLFWVNNFPIVFLVLKETLRSVFLNNLIINLVCLPTYVNLAHLVCVFPSLCSCSSFVWLTLSKIAVSYLLLYSICFIASFPLLYSASFIGYVDRLLVRYLIAASLCSKWWQKSFGMIKKYQVQAISISTAHYLWLHCNKGCFNCDYLKSVKVWSYMLHTPLLLLTLTWNVTVSIFLYSDDRVANSSTIPLNNFKVSVWNLSL